MYHIQKWYLIPCKQNWKENKTTQIKTVEKKRNENCGAQNGTLEFPLRVFVNHRDILARNRIAKFISNTTHLNNTA